MSSTKRVTGVHCASACATLLERPIAPVATPAPSMPRFLAKRCPIARDPVTLGWLELVDPAASTQRTLHRYSDCLGFDRAAWIGERVYHGDHQLERVDVRTLLVRDVTRLPGGVRDFVGILAVAPRLLVLDRRRFAPEDRFRLTPPRRSCARTHVFDIGTGECRPLGSVAERGVYAAAIHPSHATIAVAPFGSGVVALLDRDGRELEILAEASGKVTLAFSPSGDWLGWSSGGRGVTVCDYRTREVRALSTTCSAFAWADGYTLFVREGSELHAVDPARGAVVAVYTGLPPFESLVVSPERRWVALEGERELAVVDLAEGTVWRSGTAYRAVAWQTRADDWAGRYAT